MSYLEGNIDYKNTNELRNKYDAYVERKGGVIATAFPDLGEYIKACRAALTQQTNIVEAVESPENLLLIDQTVRRLKSTRGFSLPTTNDEIAAYVWEIRLNFSNFGPIEELLQDEDITDIHIHSYNHITVKRRSRPNDGSIETNVQFPNDGELRNVLDTILSTTNKKQVDIKNPLADGVLPQGERLAVAIPPVSIHGTSAFIRKQSSSAFTPEQLVKFRAFSQGINQFLAMSILSEMNIIIMGATGSGKTALISAILNYIPRNKHLLTIEDTPELQIDSSRGAYTALLTRPSKSKDSEITVNSCLRYALRSDPDYIVIGETRGGEAWEMLQAMKSGHSGITSVHASDGPECLTRLEGLCALSESASNMSPEYLRRDIAQVINLMVVQSWVGVGANKRRGIQAIYEVVSTIEEGHEPPEVLLPAFLGKSNVDRKMHSPLYEKEYGAATLRKLFYFDDELDELAIGVRPSQEFVARLNKYCKTK